MKFISVLMVVTSLISAQSAMAEQWVLDVAYVFESGKFESNTDTEIITIPVNLKLFTGRWGYGLSIPYVRVSGSDTVIPTGSASTGGGPGQGSGYGAGSGAGGPGQQQDDTTEPVERDITRTGLGDASIWVSRTFDSQQPDGWIFEVIASVELPSGDENKNLSNGESDYSIEWLTSVKQGRFSPSLSIGYQLTGDPDNVDLNDIIFVSAGVGYELADDNKLGVKLNYSQAIDDVSEDPVELGFKYLRIVNRYIDLNASFTFGLSDSSPDHAFALSMTAYY